MDALSNPAVHTVVVQSSAQVGKTEGVLNVVGFYIDQDPAPILVLQPTLEMGQAFSKDRLAPMLRDTPALKGKVKDARARDSGNTLLHKALDVSTPIPTPDGWTTMRDISVGDFVFDETGAPCRVTYVTPIVHNRPCYRVSLSDGSSIIADADHPWFVQRWRVDKSNGKPRQSVCGEVVTTLDLLEGTPKKGRKKYAIPTAGALQTPAIDLPIDPYVLGAWLGDGYSHRATIVAGSEDGEMYSLLCSSGYPVSQKIIGRGLLQFHLDPPFGEEDTCRRGHNRDEVGVTAGGNCRECRRQRERHRRLGEPEDPVIGHNVRSNLKALGLLKKAGQGMSRKHVPRAYLRASEGQRKALLQGLMDTDGSITPEGYCRFVTVIPDLADGVRELVESLGIKCSMSDRPNGRGPVYVLGFRAPDFPVFRLSRKLARQERLKAGTTNATRRRVVSVEPVSSVPVRCISVDSPSHLYLAGRQMVPTHNTFPGGHITIAGANSAASLASRPIRVLLADEVDRYPVSAGTEGDPISLARKRTTTFWNRKVLLVSTPTVKGMSRIEAAFKESDQRLFLVPCPDCGEEQRLVWSQVRWPEGRPSGAEYCCEHCGTLWSDAQRWGAVRNGRWEASAEFTGIAGFHLSELYSPWRTLAETAADFLASKPDPERLRTWVNTALGETWEDRGETVDSGALTELREPYGPDDLPDEVMYATAGVDTQDDRLEVEVLGWGDGEQSWGVGYHVLYGDPAQPSVWTELDEVLRETYTTASGRIVRVQATAIDSGGHHAESVLRFCRERFRRRVYAIKGAGGQGKPIWPLRASKTKTRDSVFMVGVDTAKDTIYARFKIEPGNAGACHLPDDPATGYDDDWMEQVTSEQRMTRYREGRPYTVWVLPKGKRNEALDCRVYAVAAQKAVPLGMRKPASDGPAKRPKRRQAGGGLVGDDFLGVDGDWL